MDFSVSNKNNYNPAFNARLNRVMKKSIMRGIKSEIRGIANIDDAMKRFDERMDTFDAIKEVLAKKPNGKFGLYNGLGADSVATKIFFQSNNRYSQWDLPGEIRDEIKLKDVSNMFVGKRYKITKFPATKLEWLLDFLKKAIV